MLSARLKITRRVPLIGMGRGARLAGSRAAPGGCDESPLAVALGGLAGAGGVLCPVDRLRLVCEVLGHPPALADRHHEPLPRLLDAAGHRARPAHARRRDRAEPVAHAVVLLVDLDHHHRRPVCLAGHHRQGRRAGARTMFVHLRLHTEFSVVDGTNRIDEWPRQRPRTASPHWPLPISTTCLAPSSSTRKCAARASSRFWAPKSCWKARPERRAARMLLLVQGHQGYLNLSECWRAPGRRNVVKAQAICTWDGCRSWAKA
jgi:hypothetical protein